MNCPELLDGNSEETTFIFYGLDGQRDGRTDGQINE